MDRYPTTWHMSLNLVCHRAALQFSLACHTPTRSACDARSLGRADSDRSVVLRLARLRGPRIRCYAHGFRVFLPGDAAFCRARRGRSPGLALRRQRLLAWHRGVSCLPDLRPGDKYFRIHAYCGRCRTGLTSARPRRFRCAQATRHMAGFCNDSCRVAGREAAAESLGMVVVTLALAVPGRASFLHFHGPPLREHRACMFLASAPRQWCRLLHRVGPPLELLHRGKFHRFRLHRHSVGPGNPFHSIRSAMVAVEVLALRFPRHSLLHRLARRVSLPRPAPKYAFARFE